MTYMKWRAFVRSPLDNATKNLVHDDEVTEKRLQIWVGRMLRQFNLYDYQCGRKDNKRQYFLSYDHVAEVFGRYKT